MLLIAGSIRIDATHRDELIATVLEVLRGLRDQVGCMHVALSADIEDPAVLHLIQKWESQEALSRYFAGPRVAGIANHAGKLGVREMALVKYDVASVRPVGPPGARVDSALP